jgi:hypothetical protein
MGSRNYLGVDKLYSSMDTLSEEQQQRLNETKVRETRFNRRPPTCRRSNPIIFS